MANSAMDADSALSVHNLAFLESLQEAFDADPASVDPQWIPYLDRDRRPARRIIAEPAAPAGVSGITAGQAAAQVALQSRVDHLVEAYRLHGHMIADIDPLGRPRSTDPARFDLACFGLDDSHLEREFHSAGLIEGCATLREILRRLRNTYCRHIGVEYWHIDDDEQRAWLRRQIEPCQNQVIPDTGEQIRLLRSLAYVEAVDGFLHSKFLGAKRFSISGAESVISLLEWLVEGAGESDIGEIIFGMAHRGRLNVLMNILGKTPREVFSEFSNLDAESYLGGGDVKYHLGYHRHHTTSSGKQIYLALAFNPSHLEAITPVLQGRIRATQDAAASAGASSRHARHRSSLGVTLHGDAAFAGQGVVAETLNMSGLHGYEVGGMIRVVINNQIGFTTNPEDSRTTTYCTDVAHGLGVPVFHVNGDDPEAAAHVARIALAWRQRYQRDAIIDLVCYRRFGHNEGDDPSYTQPQMYEIVRGHQSVRTIYQRRLVERGTIDGPACDAIQREFIERFNEDLAAVGQDAPKPAFAPMHGIWEDYLGGDEGQADVVDTSISRETIDTLAPRLLAVPDGFSVHRKMKRLLGERAKMWSGEAPWNWAAAELAAYASLLAEGTPIRFTGQDARRGTFSHRHATYVDAKTGVLHSPLARLRDGQGSFEIHNSPLSEFSVLGFEFGYSLAAPGSLVIWEAQFGDFSNGAQVIIDQFISSSEDKWNRLSGLVMLLPHGYEGQGPEHSSARLERFLQLCAEDNIQVCYPSSPAQFFHLLRRQAVRRWRKPLVVMTPKSLLRFRPCFSPIEQMTSGSFERCIDDPASDQTVRRPDVRRVLLCAGKIYYDLVAERDRLERLDVAVVRVEQLYPFPEGPLRHILGRYPAVEDLRWVQEEPENMGSWSFVARRLAASSPPDLPLRFVGRDASASPATGSPDAHQLERQMILDESFSAFSCVR
jgi:2-oxoglutarate dehydrogenase E1 component